MSKKSESKESQGYAEKGKNCGNCAHFTFEMKLQKWMEDVNKESVFLGNGVYYDDNFKTRTNLKCAIGLFTVKKQAICDMWEGES